MAADLEPLSVGTLLRTWQPETAARLGLAFLCASLAEKGARMSRNTELLLAARMRRHCQTHPLSCNRLGRLLSQLHVPRLAHHCASLPQLLIRGTQLLLAACRTAGSAFLLALSF